MSIALQGNLSDFGIAEVFQLIGQQGKTGTLVIGEGADAIFLAFDEGRVVRGGPEGARSDDERLGDQFVQGGYLTREQLEALESESERSARPLSDLFLSTDLIDVDVLEAVQNLLTRNTVFSAIRRKDGDFNFTAEQIIHDTKPENLLGAEQILMDGLRMLDEWQTFINVVPSDQAVFRRIGNLESARSFKEGDLDSRLVNAERVLQLIDGRLTVRRVVDLSHLGTFDATRALAELRQAGVIDLVTSKKRESIQPRPNSRQSRILPALRIALVSTLPFIAMGLMASSVQSPVGTEAALGGSPIPDRFMHQFGQRFETQLIRGLVEQWYFETGAYPTALEEIAAEATREDRSLTKSRLADYYYHVRDDEVVLLAPTR